MKKIILIFTICVFASHKISAQICSYLATNFPVGLNPSSIAYGDFNGDSKVDLVTTNYGSDDISILFGNGLGGFTLPTNITVGDRPKFIVCTDFNGDGKIDFEVANQGSNTVSVLLGNGFGSFSAPSFIPVGSQPSALAVVDFENDGSKDLASANFGSSNISRGPGNGFGGFGQINTTNVGTGPSSLIFADFNQDNLTDLVTANSGSNNVSLALGNGFGNFGSNYNVTFPVGNNPVSVLNFDFNGDGNMDLAIANKGSNSLSILMGNGSAAFSPIANFSVGIQPSSITNSDINGDGNMDLVTSNSGSNNISILLGNGTGSFAAAITVAVRISPESIVSSDFNGDGKMDLATANSGSNNVSILLGNGSGGFIVPPVLSETSSAIQNSSCSGTCNGEATINVFGGAPPYSYQWNASAFSQTTATASNLCASMSHSVSVTDQNDCVLVRSFFILDVAPVFAVTSSTSPNRKCSGICDGSATVIVNGMNSPYTYQWDSSASSQTTAIASNLCSGNYSVIISDANGCDTTLTVSVIQDTISASISVFPNSKCGGSCNGFASVSPNGGTAPYSYLWDSSANNQIFADAYNLCSGTYNLTITDSTGCTLNTQATIVLIPLTDPNIFLTNLAAIDMVNISPYFANHYAYNLPSTINPNPSNPRNFVDPGKKARFKVECTNKKLNGQSIVSGICKVRSNNPYITITDSSSALNNIAWNGTVWSADEFEIDIDANTPAGTNVYIDFVVQENGQDFSTTCISIPISPLVYSQTTNLTIDDDNNPDSQGNDNDTCNQGEIIEFYPWLDNISTLNAEYVRGQFENLDNHSFISIWNNVPGINTTVYDAGWWNYAFAEPQTVNSNSLNTSPEYDFVFNYGNTTLVNEFNLYMVMSGGFNLFRDSALSLVQWSLPYKFHNELSIVSQLDTPIISGNPIVCQGSDLSLSGSLVPNATSYLWTGPNGFSQVGNDLTLLSVNSNSSGAYTFYAIRAGGNENDTSYATINILITTTYNVNNPQIICSSGSYSINGNTYTLAGTYIDVLQTINGCDSIITTQLAVVNSFNSNNPQAICPGESYSIGGNTYSLAGTYVNTLQSINGCDSIVTTILTVNPTYSINNPQTICFGDSYSIGGSTYTSSGTYVNTFQSINGCDSIVTTSLTVRAIVLVNNPQTICQGGSYTIGTSTYTIAGTYQNVLISINGCDSTVTTFLTVNNPTLNTNVSISADELTLSSMDNNATYQWVNCNNNFVFIGGAVDQDFTPVSNGNYAVILTTLICNVSDTSLCFVIDNVGIENLLSVVGIKVYPNPTNSNFRIESTSSKIESLSIFNAEGKLILEKKVNLNSIEIDTQKWSDGLYLIEINTEQGIVHQKVIKE